MQTQYIDGIYEVRETVIEESRIWGTEEVNYLARVKVETKDYGYGPMQYGTLTVYRNGICTQSANAPVRDFEKRLSGMTKIN